MGVLTETKKTPRFLCGGLGQRRLIVKGVCWIFHNYGPSRHFFPWGALAQLVAHRTFNPLVPSSSLGCSTNI